MTCDPDLLNVELNNLNNLMTFRKMSAFKEAKYSHLNERHVSSECEMFPLIHDTNLQFINKLSLCPTCRTTPAPWLPRLGGRGWWPPAAGSWSPRRRRPRRIRSPSLVARSCGGQWSVLCEAAATTATSSHQSAVKVSTIFRGSQYSRKTPIFLVERGYQFFKTYQYIKTIISVGV